jgi:hypothetical protein
LKKVGLILFLLATNLIPVYADYAQPSSQEQSLYNDLLEEFTKLSIPKKDVTDTLKSFEEPLTMSFPCNGDLNNLVNVTITTRLAAFDDSLTIHEGSVTGGIYVWKCSITYSSGKLIINCDNAFMLNSDALLESTEKEPQIKLAEDLVVFYHELLHGQLMIDAIRSSDTWRNDTCNKQFHEDLDYSYTDADHKIITPLQTEFAGSLIKNAGGIFKVMEILPQQTTNGEFSKKVASLYDYPEYVKTGINVSARSYHISDIQIKSEKNEIHISGHLSNKTQTGIIWLYIFGRPSDTTNQINVPTKNVASEIEVPSWIKNNARWWADGTIEDSDFISGIKFLVNQQIIKIPQTAQGASSSQHIPQWIKSNAKWWAEGTITTSDFVLGVQYLIKNGIMQVLPEQISDPSATKLQQGSTLKINENVFEKKSYKTAQLQITGKVEDFKTGTFVVLTITRPDHSTYDLNAILTNKGQFTVPLVIDKNWEAGKYLINARYFEADIGTVSFIIK